MRSVAAFFLALCFSISALAGTSGKGSHSSHTKSSSKTSKTSKSKSKPASTKTVHVKGYTRKDGTHVAAYDRSAPGTASGNSSQPSPTPYHHDHIAQGYTADSTVTRDSHGKIKRSAAAKDAFKREHPCPATGSATGACKGYVIDHVKPLECGGADAPFNMQWQTVADGKAKDKTERFCH